MLPVIMKAKPLLRPAACLVLAGICVSAGAQEEPAAELESAGRAVLADPRLRNALRNARQDPAVEGFSENPEEAVREAARRFQAKVNGVDADQLKAAAAKMQSDGTLDAAVAKASEVIRKETAPAKPATQGPAPEPVPAIPQVSEAPANVPATRPAPAVAGGEPTPVAMPLEPGAPPAEPVTQAPAADAPAMVRATEALPSAVAAVTDSATLVREAGAPPAADVPPTTRNIPDTPTLSLDDIPEPVPLAKKYQPEANGAYPAPNRKHMEILAKESVMDNTKGLLIFTGNVFVDAPDYEMKCDKLEIHLADGVGMEGGGESDSSFKRAIASGGMVEIKRFAVDEKGRRKTQIALGRKADYNAITKEFVLSGGPPYIQDGDRFVKTNSEDAKIIMRGNGLYEITGSSNRVQISIPVDDEGPGKKKGAPGLPTGLEGAMDRIR